MNKIRVVIKWLFKNKRGEIGQVLPIVLVTMVLGSLLIVPSLNYVSTSLKASEMIEENLEGLYAAEAGVEDALWKLNYDKPSSFPHSYQLTNINGMTVSVVIDETTTVAGKDIGSSGTHDEYLEVTKSVDYEDGIYDYTLQFSNNGTGNVKIEMVLVDFPPHLEYVEGSTAGDLFGDDPTVVGDADTGITLYWDLLPPYPTIPEGEMRVHTFQLTGPEGVDNAEGHACVRATRQDVGTVWDVESRPYSIIAEAKDATATVVATVRAGVWEGDASGVTCWQVNP